MFLPTPEYLLSKKLPNFFTSACGLTSPEASVKIEEARV